MRAAAFATLIATVAGPSAATVSYFGGPVIENAKVYAVWWGPGIRLSPMVNAPKGGMADFFTGVLDSSYLDWLNEYDTDLAAQGGARAGSAGTNQHIGRGNFAGVFELDDIPPGSVTDEQVQAVLLDSISKGVLPADDRNSVYAIFFPSSVNIDNSCKPRDGFEAYHYATAGAVNGVVYLVIADCGIKATNYFGEVASHELIESITDRVPTPGDVPDYPQAWNDADAFEVADLCDSVAGASVPTLLGTFPVQKIWDNASNGCSSTHTFAQDYNVALEPSVVELQPGQTLAVTVRTATVAGSAQPLVLSVTTPAGLNASFDNAAIASGGSATLTLTFNADASVPRDSQVVVSAQGTTGSRSQRHSAAVLLQPPEFTLYVGRQSGELSPGGSTTVPIGITPLHGEVGSVQLSVSGLPAQVTGSFSSIAKGTATLTLRGHGAALVTDAQFIVTARGPTATHSAAGLYTVTPGHGCSTSGDGLLLFIAALATLATRRQR